MRFLDKTIHIITLQRAAVLLVAACVPTSAVAAEHPNVLFISIDDLNDWVGVFGGHAEARTPQIDRLASEGSMIFQNAHCPGPVCGPSRSALLSGFMPHRTGIYGNSNNMLDSELVQTHATLPEYFSRHGYTTLSRGKIAHRHATARGTDAGHWMYDVWVQASGGMSVDPDSVTSRNRNLINGKPAPPSEYTARGGSEFAWGVTRDGKDQTKDYLTAQWAAQQLQQHHDKPFFLAVGLSKPHLPFYSPREFWDLFPADGNYLPEIQESDFDDILLPNGNPAGRKTLDYLWLEQNKLLNEAARAYLACCSYADHCVGVILEGLRNSPHADNTVIVLWGDHGWHLGEKLRYRKAELWSESTRCPLVVRLPGMSGRQDCHQAVNLIDLYPTLIELCRLPAKPNLDGKSFAALLQDPTQQWEPTITIRGEGNVAVHDQRWNLIYRRNGVRELYDLRHDPMEWTNLFGQEGYQQVQETLAACVPHSFAPAVKNSKSSGSSNGLDQTIRPHRIRLDLK